MGIDEQRQVVLKMDGGASPAGKIWRESSYDFLSDAQNFKQQHRQAGAPDRHHNNQCSDNSNGSESYRFDFNSPSNGNSKSNTGRDGRMDGRGDASPTPSTAALMDDPPSKLIGQFLHKQKASGEYCLDMDLEMAELQNDAPTVSLHRNLTPVSESSPMAGNRVSFDPNPPDSVRRRQLHNKAPSSTSSPSKHSEGDGGGRTEGEISKSSSRNDKSLSANSSFNRRKSSLLKERTKSRLLDPPPEKSGRMGGAGAGVGRSGFLGRTNAADEEEDDPLLEEDLPEEYKKDKFDIWVLLEWVSLILIIAALVCSLAIPYMRSKTLWGLRLWKWEVLVLVLICGRLVSGWVITIIVFFIERNFLLRKRVLYFVYGIKKAVQNCLWLGLVLIAWHCLFDNKVYVTKVLVCLVVATLMWLVKTLVIKVLASSFLVSKYFHRIQESLFNQYVIETLSGPPMVEIEQNDKEEERILAEVDKLQNAGATVPPGLKACAGSFIRSARFQKSSRIGTPRLSRSLSTKVNEECVCLEYSQSSHQALLNPNNVSAWNMERLVNIILDGCLSMLDEQIQNSHQDNNESVTQIRSEHEAKCAASKIFQNVARPGSRFIYLEDIMRFMREDDASKAMSLFKEPTDSEEISEKCLKNWVVIAFRDRRALALTLNDTKTAVNKLHRMANILVGILIAVIGLLILGIATSKVLLFVSSQLVVVAFIFGNACKTVFEAIIFLFVIHPFDVGDRCEIDGVQMTVEEMNILNTVFLRCDNQKIIIANSVLATKSISNFYRSPGMGDAIEFLVHVATPAEKIALMKQRINSYIENKKEHWYPSPMIILRDTADLTKVRIAMWLTHGMNHQDMGERFTRRSLLVEGMTKIFRELDIQHRLFALGINVRMLPPLTSDRLPPNWTSSS